MPHEEEQQRDFRPRPKTDREREPLEVEDREQDGGRHDVNRHGEQGRSDGRPGVLPA